MTSVNLQDNLNWLLIRASILAKQRLMKVSETYKLTPAQALALCSLEPGEATPMHKISNTLVCDASTVTGIVDRLSSGGYIERRESSTDRRIKTITLTAAGNELREALLPKIAEKGAPNLEHLTAEEITTLKRLITKTLPEANA